MSRAFVLSEALVRQIKRDLRGSMPSWKATRLRVLLALREGMSLAAAAEHVGCGTATVTRIKARYRRGGYAAVLEDGRKTGRPRKLSTREEKELIALACSSPPGSSERWTVRLLAKHFDKDVSVATVHRVLTRDGIKPWREKNVVRGRARRRIPSSTP